MPRDIVAANLKALMEAHPELDTLTKITAAGGGANGTLDRMRRGDAACRVDALARVARVFGLQAWQMLVPGLDPKNPPRLEMEQARADQLAAELRQIAARINHQRT